MNEPRPIKSIYTPVFNLTPIPSSSYGSSKSESKAVLSYLDKLSRKHVALAQIVDEIPSSRPGSPVLEAYIGSEATPNTLDNILDNGKQKEIGNLTDVQVQRIKRVEGLRAQVVDAFHKAKGEPGDGKWGYITQMLRMGCTTGRYGWSRGWSSSEDNDVDPSADISWILPETEEEWNQWERMYEHKRKLKHKVETWQHRVEHVVIEPESQPTQPQETQNEPNRSPKTSLKRKTSTKSSIANATAPSKQGSLQFNVAKRTSAILANAADKPHDPPNDLPKLKPSARPVDPKHQPTKDKPPPDSSPANNLKSSPMSVDAGKKISDISETHFFPPSFPSSQLQTSTPRQTLDSRTKIPPISRPPDSSPTSIGNLIPPITPDFSSQKYDNLLPPSSPNRCLPPPSSVPPSSPCRPLTSSSSLPSTPIRAPNSKKRRLDDSPGDGAALKKARTLAIFPSTKTAVTANANEAVTTDDSHVDVELDWPKAVDPDSVMMVTPERKDKDKVPTLTELLASRKKGVPGTPKKNAPASTTSPSSDSKKARGAVQVHHALEANVQPPSNSPPVSRSKPQSRLTLGSLTDANKSTNTITNVQPDAPDAPMASRPDGALHLSTKDMYEALDFSSYNPYDVDLSSPAKSLSSIAGSDSEDSDNDNDNVGGPGELRAEGFTQNPGGFEPVAASTQVDGHGHGHGYGYGFGQGEMGPSQGSTGRGFGGFGMYNSQFDVEGEVDRVSELLERDVDFDGWLRDVSVEDDA